MSAFEAVIRRPRDLAVSRLAWLLAALVAALFAAPWVVLSPDARYSLAWGAELARGHLPDLTDPQVSTDHPLPIAIGAVLSVLGARAAADVYAVLAVLAFFLLVYACFRLGRALAGTTAGVLSAVVLATRPRVDFFAAHSFVDVPFAALVLLAAALAVEARENGRRVLWLLLLAGLLRPEAWGLTIAWGAWLLWSERRESRRVLAGIAALALAAPAIWIGFDWIVTGDPLHAVHGTRQGAAFLERVRGVGNLGPTMTSAVAAIVGWPLAVAGTVAGAWRLASAWRVGDRETVRRVGLVLGLALAGFAAFAALALADLPLNDRYLLVPTLALAVLWAGSLGWLAARPGPGRAVLAGALALGLVSVLVTAPIDVRATKDMLAASHEKHAADADLEILLARHEVRRAIDHCPHLIVAGSGRATAAALLGRDPVSIPIGRSAFPPFGTGSIATSDKVKPGFRGSVREGSWIFIDRCHGLPPDAR
ncbi:MAG: hypothetical protein ACJ76V_17175 [Thermoleophilaceae bacterium]